MEIQDLIGRKFYYYAKPPGTLGHKVYTIQSFESYNNLVWITWGTIYRSDYNVNQVLKYIEENIWILFPEENTINNDYPIF